MTEQPTIKLKPITPDLAQAIYAVLIAGVGCDPIWASPIEKRILEGKDTLIDGILGSGAMICVSGPGHVFVKYSGPSTPERSSICERTNRALRRLRETEE